MAIPTSGTFTSVTYAVETTTPTVTTDWKAELVEDVQVLSVLDGVETELTYSTHYALDDLGVATGFSVLLVGDIAAGTKIFVSLATPLTEVDRFAYQGSFSSSKTQSGFDRSTNQAKNVLNETARSIKFPLNEIDTLTGELPKASERSDKWMGFDINGEPEVRDTPEPIIVNVEGGGTGVSVKSEPYGAKGDGITDDTLAIQSLFDAGIKNAYFPAGDYLVSPQTDTVECITITGVSDLTITFDNGARLIGDPIVGLEALVIEGHNDDTYTYTYHNLATSDVVKGDITIELTSGEGSSYSAGDWVKLQSEGLLDGPMGGLGEKKGELLKILSISTDTLTFHSALLDSYLLADTAQISLVPFVENITINGFNGNNCWRNFSVSYAENIRINNTTITNQSMVTGNGISIRNAVGCTIRNTVIDQADYYGIAVDLCSRDFLVDGINCYGARHAFTTLQSGSHGIVRNWTVRNGNAYNSSLSGWDTHQSGENGLMENLRSFKDGDHGFQIRAWKTTLRDCYTEHSLNDGYSCEAADVTNVKHFNCISDGAARDGFNSVSSDPEYIDCEAHNSGTHGWRLQGGRIKGGKATGNVSGVFGNPDSGTPDPVEIDGLNAPFDAVQVFFVRGGNGFAQPISNVSVINCTIPGYDPLHYFKSANGVTPFHKNNIIFQDGTESHGTTTLASGEAEVLLGNLPVNLVNGPFYRAFYPSFELQRIDSYYLPVTFDDTDVSTVNDWINVVIEPSYTYGDLFTFVGTIGGLTSGNDYFVSRGGFPGADNIRLGDNYSTATVAANFTSALNGLTVVIEVTDSSAFSVSERIVLDDEVSLGQIRSYDITAITDGTHLTIQTVNVDGESLDYTIGAPVYNGSINLTSASGTGMTLTPSIKTNGGPLNVSGFNADSGFLIKSDDPTESGSIVRWEINY